MPPPPIRRPATLTTIGLGLTITYLVLPYDSPWATPLYSFIGVSAGLFALLGVRRQPHGARLGWLLVSLGVCAFALGDVVFDYTSAHRHPFAPSGSDAFYLGVGYPLFLAGTWVIGQRGATENRLVALVDAAIVAAAFALVQGMFLVEPALSGGGSFSSRAIRALYPSMDTLLAVPLVRLFWPRLSIGLGQGLLAAGIALTLAADAVFYGRGTETNWTDGAWLLAYLCWGLSSNVGRGSARPGAARGPEPTTRRLALLAVAVATPSAVLAVQALRGAPAHPAIVASFGVVLTALAFARVVGLTRLIERLRFAERGLRIDAEAANEHLRELDRLKDEFVSVVTHDLRMPLAAARGYVELLLAEEPGPLTPKQVEALGIVRESVERGLLLTRDLSFVAEAEAGRLDLEVARVDVVDVVHRAVAAFVPRARGASLELTFAAPARADVFGDGRRLGQLLDNLLANAIAYSTVGGRVHVEVAPKPSLVAITVSDTGVGIAPEDRERLFESFYRGSRTRSAPGSGLGLYIAKMIVDAHGGRISLESEPDAGTTVLVELPLADVAR